MFWHVSVRKMAYRKFEFILAVGLRAEFFTWVGFVASPFYPHKCCDTSEPMALCYAVGRNLAHIRVLLYEFIKVNQLCRVMLRAAWASPQARDLTAFRTDRAYFKFFSLFCK